MVLGGAASDGTHGPLIGDNKARQNIRFYKRSGTKHLQDIHGDRWKVVHEWMKHVSTSMNSYEKPGWRHIAHKCNTPCTRLWWGGWHNTYIFGLCMMKVLEESKVMGSFWGLQEWDTLINTLQIPLGPSAIHQLSWHILEEFPEDTRNPAFCV